jgi:hypothetical protein
MTSTGIRFFGDFSFVFLLNFILDIFFVDLLSCLGVHHLIIITADILQLLLPEGAIFMGSLAVSLSSLQVSLILGLLILINFQATGGVVALLHSFHQFFSNVVRIIDLCFILLFEFSLLFPFLC